MADPPSRLATARFIADINQVAYPEHIDSPRIELNVRALPGKFRYDRDFLLQFRNVCKAKPDHLPPLETFLLGVLNPGYVNPNVRGGRKKNLPPPVNMPFPNEPAKLATPLTDNNEDMRSVTRYSHPDDELKLEEAMRQAQRVEEVVRTANASDRTGRRADNMAVLEVQSLLNTLTPDDFDFVSDLIVMWANSSEGEEDASTLAEITRLVFEKAVSEATSSQLYVRLSRKIMEQLNSAVLGKGTENHPVTGGDLFQKLLVNRCQQDFERVCLRRTETTAVDTSSSVENTAVEKNGDNELLHSNETHANKQTKRLGLIRFIGELIKAQILEERVVHECIRKLLINIDDPREEEVESICALLETVGPSLDTTNGRIRMDIYFRRVKSLSSNEKVDSRLRSKFLEVIELRERNWGSVVASRRVDPLEQVIKERERAQRMNFVPRGGFGARGVGRGPGRGRAGIQVSSGSKTWASLAASSKLGDLSHFGKLTNTVPGATGFSVFAGQHSVEQRQPPSLSRATSYNPFVSLTEHPGKYGASVSSTARSRIPSVDFSIHGNIAGGHHRKLQLLPRSPSALLDDDDEALPMKVAPKTSMSDAMIKRQIDSDTKEFFALRKLDEAEVYFESLPAGQRYKMVDSVFTKALEGKDAKATLVGGLFAKVVRAGKLTSEDIEDGVVGTIEFLDDIAIDVPAVYALAAKMLFMAKLDEEAVKRLGDQIAVEGDPLVAPKDKLLVQFRKLAS